MVICRASNPSLEEQRISMRRKSSEPSKGILCTLVLIKNLICLKETSIGESYAWAIPSLLSRLSRLSLGISTVRSFKSSILKIYFAAKLAHLIEPSNS